MSDGTIRVVLTDDRTVVRPGLKAVLGAARDIHVIGEAQKGREAVAMAERLDTVCTEIGAAREGVVQIDFDSADALRLGSE